MFLCLNQPLVIPAYLGTYTSLLSAQPHTSSAPSTRVCLTPAVFTLPRLLLHLLHGSGDLGAIDAKYDVAVSTATGGLDYVVVETASDAQVRQSLLTNPPLCYLKAAPSFRHSSDAKGCRMIRFWVCLLSGRGAVLPSLPDFAPCHRPYWAYIIPLPHENGSIN